MSDKREAQKAREQKVREQERNIRLGLVSESRRRFEITITPDAAPQICQATSVFSESVDLFKASPVNPHDANQRSVYVPLTQDAEEELARVNQTWEELKSKKVVDGTFDDQATLHKKQTLWVPQPDGMDILSAWLGIEKDKIVVVNRAVTKLMANVFRYALLRISQDPSSPWEFQGIKAQIGQKSYSIPDGMQNLQTIQISHNVSIAAPSAPSVGIVARQERRKVALVCQVNWGVLSISVFGTTQEDAEGVLDWLMDEVQRHNFYKGARINGLGEFMDIKPTSWKDIAIPASERQKIERYLIAIYQYQESFVASGLPDSIGFALVGELGTGKTTVVKILATILKNLTFIWVSPSSLPNGAASIDEIYDFAQMLAPALVFFEDAERYLTDQYIITTLMNRLSGAVQMSGVITGLSTNNPKGIDSAFMDRPGRFDFTSYLGPCDGMGRLTVLSDALSQIYVKKSDIEAMANVRDIVGFVPVKIIEVARRAIKLAIYSGRVNPEDKKAIVTLKDFELAAAEFKSEAKLRDRNYLMLRDGDDNQYDKVDHPMVGNTTDPATYMQAQKKPMGVSMTSESIAGPLVGILRSAVLEAIDGDEMLVEAVNPDVIKDILSVQLGDDYDLDVVYDRTLSDDPALQKKIQGIMDDNSTLQVMRRRGVRKRSIETAKKLMDEDDSSLEDIVIALTGRS